MATYYSPEGNPEIWGTKPEGFFTEDEWNLLHKEEENIVIEQFEEERDKLEILKSELLNDLKTTRKAFSDNSIAIYNDLNIKLSPETRNTLAIDYQIAKDNPDYTIEWKTSNIISEENPELTEFVTLDANQIIELFVFMRRFINACFKVENEKQLEICDLTTEQEIIDWRNEKLNVGWPLYQFQSKNFNKPFKYSRITNKDDNRLYGKYTSPYIFRKLDTEIDPTTYLGVELELIFTPSNRKIALDHLESIGFATVQNPEPTNSTYFWLSTDLTPPEGLCSFELVSHPHTLNLWKSRYNDLATYFNILAPLVNFDVDLTRFSPAMQIHITKTDMNDEHKLRFQTFFDLFTPLFVDNKYLTIASGTVPRYRNHRNFGKKLTFTGNSLVNWINKKTVEIRHFYSTLDVNAFLNNLSLVHSIKEFTRDNVTLEEMIISNSEDTVWNKFYKFLNEKPEYDTLLEQLVSHKLF